MVGGWVGHHVEKRQRKMPLWERTMGNLVHALTFHTSLEPASMTPSSEEDSQRKGPFELEFSSYGKDGKVIIPVLGSFGEISSAVHASIYLVSRTSIRRTNALRTTASTSSA